MKHVGEPPANGGTGGDFTLKGRSAMQYPIVDTQLQYECPREFDDASCSIHDMNFDHEMLTISQHLTDFLLKFVSANYSHQKRRRIVLDTVNKENHSAKAC